MNAETRVCRATKRSFVEEVSFCHVPLRLRGGADRDQRHPRLSISQVLENQRAPHSNLSLNESEIDVNLELVDAESVNVQIVIDMDLDGNMHLIADSPLVKGFNEDLNAEIVSKRIDDGIQTQIEFLKSTHLELTSVQVSKESHEPDTVTEDEFFSGFISLWHENIFLSIHFNVLVA